jgi:hypothetical protein
VERPCLYIRDIKNATIKSSHTYAPRWAAGKISVGMKCEQQSEVLDESSATLTLPDYEG